MANRKAAESATGRTSSISSPSNPSVRPSGVGASLGASAGESWDGWAGIKASSLVPRMISAAHSPAGDAAHRQGGDVRGRPNSPLSPRRRWHRRAGRTAASGPDLADDRPPERLAHGHEREDGTRHGHRFYALASLPRPVDVGQ